MTITHNVFVNKTLHYLYPQIGVYGKTLMESLHGSNGQNILAVGYLDWVYKRVKDVSHEGLLFILVDKNGKYNLEKGRYVSLEKGKINFESFLKYIRTHKAYLDDYMFDFKNCHHHMVILRLPKRFERAYQPFLKGEYSKMYTSDEITEMGFKPNKGAKIWYVLNKDAGHREKFLERINTEFGTTLTLEEINDGRELDTPPITKNETFNYDCQ